MKAGESISKNHRGSIYFSKKDGYGQLTKEKCDQIAIEHDIIVIANERKDCVKTVRLSKVKGIESI